MSDAEHRDAGVAAIPVRDVRPIRQSLQNTREVPGLANRAPVSKSKLFRGRQRNWPTGGLHEPALMEALLRNLSRNPDRIDEAARLIADLGRTEEEKDLLPEGLAEIWRPVWAARETLRG